MEKKAENVILVVNSLFALLAQSEPASNGPSYAPRPEENKKHKNEIIVTSTEKGIWASTTTDKCRESRNWRPPGHAPLFLDR